MLLVLIVAATALALGACGNKGPLVLPDKAPAQPDDGKPKDRAAKTATPAAAAADATHPR